MDAESVQVEPKTVRPSTDLKEAAGVIAPVAQVAQPLVETACSLVNDLLGPGFKEAGRLFRDAVYEFRARNRVLAVSRAAQLLKARNATPKALPPGFLLTALESVGDCDDPDVRELWAQLLANAATIDQPRHPLYVDALRRMSGNEARLLARMWASWHPLPPEDRWYFAWQPNTGLSWEPDPGEYEVHGLFALEALMIVSKQGYVHGASERQPRPQVVMTTFGIELSRAVGLCPTAAIPPK